MKYVIAFCLQIEKQKKKKGAYEEKKGYIKKNFNLKSNLANTKKKVFLHQIYKELRKYFLVGKKSTLYLLKKKAVSINSLIAKKF